MLSKSTEGEVFTISGAFTDTLVDEDVRKNMLEGRVSE